MITITALQDVVKLKCGHVHEVHVHVILQFCLYEQLHAHATQEMS